MGTRSNTVVYDGATVLCFIYRQMDGYPSAHGLDLAKACNVTIVNGLGGSKDVANGMGCLAARIIATLKDGPGGIYLFDPASEPDEEYVYEVRGHLGELPTIKCRQGDKVLFDLPADRAIAFCKRN